MTRVALLLRMARTSCVVCAISASAVFAQNTESLDPVKRGWQPEVFWAPNFSGSEGTQAFTAAVRTPTAATNVGLRVLVAWYDHHDGHPLVYVVCSNPNYPQSGCQRQTRRYRERFALLGGELDAEIPMGSIRLVPSAGVGILPATRVVQSGQACYTEQPYDYPPACTAVRDSTFSRERGSGTYMTVGAGLRIRRVLVNVQALVLSGEHKLRAHEHFPVAIGLRF